MNTQKGIHLKYSSRKRKLKLQYDTKTHARMADSKKTTTTTTMNWQRCEATQNAYTMLVGVSSSKSSLENCFAASTKTKHSRALWSKILTHTQQKWVNMCKKKTKMFVFGAAPTWKPPRCSSTQWVRKRRHSHTSATTQQKASGDRRPQYRCLKTQCSVSEADTKENTLWDFICIKYKTGLLLQDNAYPQWLWW